MSDSPQSNPPKRGMLLSVAESIETAAIIDVDKHTNSIKWLNNKCKKDLPWIKYGEDIRDWIGYLEARNEWSVAFVSSTQNTEIPVLFCRESSDILEWYAAYSMGDYGEGVFLKLEPWARTSKEGTEYSVTVLTAVNAVSITKLYSKVEMLSLKQTAEIRDLRINNSSVDSEMKSIRENLRLIEKDLNNINSNVDYANKTAMASIESMKKISEDINKKLDLQRDSIVSLMTSDEALKGQLDAIKNSLRETTQGSVDEIQGAVKKVSTDITKNVTIPASVAMATISFIQWLLSHYIGK